MVVSVVQIGNSRGVRLPKSLLEQLAIVDKLDMEVENSRIILKAVPTSPRAGWDSAFKKMNQEGEDSLIAPDELPPQGFEWEW